MYIKKITDISSILFHKGGLKYLTSSGASLSSFRINQSLKEYVNDINTIIDVGANIGQYAIASTNFFKNAKIYCFEPLPDTYGKLKQNISKHSSIQSFNLALGREEGKLNFFQNEHSHASSALEVSDFQKENIPQTSKFKKIEVNVQTLDSIDFIEYNSPILLKLDVQGFEKEVLLGGTKALDKVDYLLFETSFTPMYKNEPLFGELHNYVTQKGFEIIAPVGMLKVKNKILQLDMLYRRKK